MSSLLIQWDRARCALPARRPLEMISMSAERGDEQEALPPGDYASPLVADIGDVRDLTAGSASSGKKDANSQFYW